jgi:hypothetical protein
LNKKQPSILPNAAKQVAPSFATVLSFKPIKKLYIILLVNKK